MTQYFRTWISSLTAFGFATLLLISFQSYGQNNYGCPIFIDNPKELSSILGAPRMVTNNATTGPAFDNLTNVIGRDEQTVDITLAPRQNSSTLYLSDFGFNLPTGVNITGVEVIIAGNASVPNALRDIAVSLATGANQAIGSNKANRSFGGKPWSHSNIWSYGSVHDMWSADLDYSAINNSSFGVIVQMSNRMDTIVHAYLDQLAVRVHYQPVLQICEHPCIAVMTPMDNDVVSYSWNVHESLVAETSEQLDNVVNIYADQSPYGDYEICLTMTYADGQTDNCCRPVHYDDCTPGSIGDRIWEDRNGNGIQDAGEPDLDGFNVRLFDASFQLVATTIAQNGRYRFENLEMGQYVVAVDLKDYKQTQFTDSDTDNNSDLTGLYYYGSTSVINLGPGENRNDIDLGLIKYSQICGHAWRDRDGDGIETDADSDLTVVTVSLYDSSCSLIGSTPVDAEGNYCFDNLGGGSYFLDYDLPDGYFVRSYGLVNIADPTTGKVSLMLDYDDSSLGNDISAYMLSNVGDRVWDDQNGNGVMDPSEPGIPDVRLNIFRCSDEFVQTTTTDAWGAYQFRGLSPGEYYVCVETTPVGYAPTIKDTSSDMGSVANTDGCSDCFSIMDDTTRADLDFGFVFSSSTIGDVVWYDANENGQLDQGESGLSDVTVTLSDCNNNVIQSQLTDAAGNYRFDEVGGGNYIICIDESYREYTVNPAVVTGGNCTTCFLHDGSADDFEKDFGLILERATVDSKVYVDANGNGFRDDNETLVPGIMTELYTCAGELVAADDTDTIGGSWFADLEPGNYYIRVILPAEYSFITNGGDITGANGVGTSDCFDVQGIGRTIRVGLTNVVVPETYTVCTNVWDDTNDNNLQDNGESVIGSLEFDILDCSGNLVQSIISDATGVACISSLQAGEYYLSMTTPDGYEAGDLSPITEAFGPGTTDCFLVNSDLTIDIALVEEQEEVLPVTLSAVLFEDINADTSPGMDEPIFDNLSVMVFSCNDIFIGAMQYDLALEAYTMQLVPGDYYLQVDLIDGYTFTDGSVITDANGLATTDCISIGTEQTINIGYVREVVAASASLSGVTWLDSDINGIRDASEAAMDQVRVSLYNEDLLLLEDTYSDIQGVYAFQDVEDGDYFIQFERLQDYRFTSYRAGGVSNEDSEVIDLNLGMTDTISVQGSNVEYINAGFVERPTAMISGQVWLDADQDGLVGATEQGIEGVVIRLMDDMNIEVTQTTSAADGQYEFSNLSEGMYYLVFENQDYTFTEANVGGTSDVDSEVINLVDGFTSLYIVNAGDQLTGVNAGLYTVSAPAISVISGQVWLDENRNGEIDAQEGGVEGSVVKLMNDSNVEVAQIVTNAQGQYSFSGLAAGLYYIAFDKGIYDFAAPNVAGNSLADSEVVNTDLGYTGLYNVDGISSYVGINAGLQEDISNLKGSMNGQVWLDVNANGLIDDAELGIENIAVILRDDTNSTVAQTATNSEGNYSFTDLEAGLYYVAFERQSYFFSDPKLGGNSDLDSEVLNTTDGFTGLYIVNVGDEVHGVNAGMYTEIPARETFISGSVWLDKNVNGLIDADEAGIENIIVTLYDDTNTEVSFATTDAEGYYKFHNLDAGMYYLGFGKMDYFFSDAQAAGGFSVLDSEVINSVSGYTGIYVLEEGDQLVGINAGLYSELAPGTASISGQVWFDENQDGLISDMETGVADVTVILMDDNNAEVTRVLSDATGNYAFENLHAGLYFVWFQQRDYIFVMPNVGGTLDIDSEVLNLDMGYTPLYPLADQEVLTGINAGLYFTAFEPGQIAGNVWEDENENGIIDEEEAGLDNVSVSLYDDANSFIGEVITDENGDYNFTDVVPGFYYVSVAKPDGYTHTIPNANGTSDLDSEVVNFVTSNTNVFEVQTAQNRTGINAGFYETPEGAEEGDVFGNVWEDFNGNGLIDAGEEFTESVRVVLREENGGIVAVQTTGPGGRYLFSAVPNGSYVIAFTLPLDSKATAQDQGSEEIDSDIDAETGFAQIEVTGTALSGVNAGYFYPASIGDYVWLDINGNGVQDPDEEGANNYIINLHDADNNFIERVWSNFDANLNPGFYQFNDLAPGQYIIRVTTQQGIAFSPAEATDADNDSNITNTNGAGSTDLIDLNSGMQLDDIDIGLVLAPATLGNQLWIDANGNGINDDGEVGLNDVTVELYNIHDNLVGTTVTATVNGEDGIYLFEDIYPTEYYVKFLIPDGYVTTKADEGGVDANDSDIDDSNGLGTTSIFLLSPAETDLDVDGGVFLDAFIGDKVWHDRNKDGLQDANEPGVEDIAIKLMQRTDTGDVELAEIRTDRLGEYRFNGVANGDYYLIIYPSEDFEPTLSDIGTDDSLDSDANALGVTEVFTISNSVSNETIDFGLVRPGNQIGGFAWEDQNENGVIDAGEPYREDVTIWLMNENSLVMIEMETGTAGIYLFKDLEDGEYFIKAAAPVDFTFTLENFGIDDDIDSDFDSDGNSEMITVQDGTVVRNVNVGFVALKKKRPSQIYPNPVSGPEVTITAEVYKDDLEVSYLMTDSKGGVIGTEVLDQSASKGIHEYTVGVEPLEEGVYFIKLMTGRRVEHLRIIKVSH